MIHNETGYDALKTRLCAGFDAVCDGLPRTMAQRVTLPRRADHESSAGSRYLPSYWTEGAAYQINAAQAKELNDAAAAITECYRHAFDHMAENPDILKRFVFGHGDDVDQNIRDIAIQSWRDEKDHGYVLDRYDLAYNGTEPPKLLERNFGFLGLIVASGEAQKEYIDWLKTQEGHEDSRSFGSMDESVAQSFRTVLEANGVEQGSVVSLVVPPEPPNDHDPEIAQSYKFYEDAIRNAGYVPKAHIVDEPDSCSLSGACYMPAHAYEHLKNLAHGKSAPENTQMIQPFWSYLAQHKAMLSVLHDLFPDHPNLLPTVMGADGLDGEKRIIKRVLTSAGAGALVLDENGKALDARAQAEWDQDDAPYSSITQSFAGGAGNSRGEFAVVNVFTANGVAVAAGVREADTAIVSDEAESKTRFAPVIIRDDNKIMQPDMHSALKSGGPLIDHRHDRV